MSSGRRSFSSLAGTSPTALSPLAQTPRGGFETAVMLPTGTVGPYVAVQALDASGRALGVSQAASEPGLAAGG
jgi:hypothetical protein